MRQTSFLPAHAMKPGRLFTSAGAAAALGAAALAPAAVAGPRVIGGWNAARGGDMSVITGGCTTSFRAELTALFPAAELRGTSTLTNSFLAGVDVLIISVFNDCGGSAVTPLTIPEQAALINFVQNGGTAVLLCETNTGDFVSTNASYLDPFGVSAAGSGLTGVVSIVVPGGDPISNGPAALLPSFTIFAGTDFPVLGSNAAELGLGPAAAPGLVWVPPNRLAPGSGAVVMLGDSTSIQNGFVDASFVDVILNAAALSGGPPRMKHVQSQLAESGGELGASVSGVPDADGDGRGDVLVGAPTEDHAFVNAGRAYLFSGATGSLLQIFVSPSFELSGEFGWSVSGVPDADGDGRGDVLVGARRETVGFAGAGRAYLFNGATGALLRVFVSPNGEFDGQFGYSVSGVPDADGDGRGDVLVGAFGESGGTGRAYLFSGDTGALLRTFVSPNPTVSGFFGFSVSGLPDADGDGRGDALVGAKNESGGATEAGRAYLFNGANGALLRTFVSPNPQFGGHFGESTSGAHDADGDGRGDVIIGARSEDGGASSAGRAYLFSGDTGSLLRTFVSPNPQANGFFGFSVSGVSDADGDGRGDVIIGARSEDGGASSAGRAYLFSGDTGSLLRTFISPNAEAGGSFGFSVSGTPDVDGDARGDAVVGADLENGAATDAGRAYLITELRPPVLGGWDVARGGNASLASGSGTASLRTALMSDFPGIAFTESATLTSAYLNTIDVLFIVSNNFVNAPIAPLSGAEQTALLDFVEDGGTAILVCDNDSFHPDADITHESYVDPFGMDISGTLGGAQTITISNTSTAVTNGPFGTPASYLGNFVGTIPNIGAFGEELGHNPNFTTALAWIPPGQINTGSGTVLVFAADDWVDDGQNGAYDLVSNAVFVSQQVGQPPPAAGPANIRFVDASASPGGDGLGWGTAYQFLQDALVEASGNPVITEIWVANGSYFPDEGGGNAPGDRAASFFMAPGLKVYGGFAGGETQLSQRNPAANMCILSGDLNADDLPSFANRSDNSLHVVDGTLADTDSLLDGFTIRGGHADGISPEDDGGGLYNGSGQGVYLSLIFTDNYAIQQGGAVFTAGIGNPFFGQCSFDGNLADSRNDAGGAIGAIGGSATIENCTFSGNQAGNGGAIDFVGGDTVSISYCGFEGNDAFGTGGAIRMYETGHFLIESCTFMGNGAGLSGGGLYVDDSSGQIVQSGFETNSADTSGGAVGVNFSIAIFTSCVFAGNSAGEGGAASVGSSKALFANCVFSTNSCDDASGAGGGAITGEAFVDCSTFFANSSPISGGAVTGPILFTNSILWGNIPDQFGAGSPNFSFCDVQGIATIGGNINADPLFQDPDGADDALGTLDDDLRLSDNSPCIDAGNNNQVSQDFSDLDGDSNDTESLPYDQLGSPRFVDDPGVADTGSGTPPIVDMGAHEFQEVSGGPAGPYPFDLFGDIVDGVVSRAVVLADIDLDGTVDFLCGSGSPTPVFYLVNNGGAPPSFTQVPIAAGASHVVDVFAADLDRDGDMEVVSVTPDADVVHWHENVGGGFQTHLVTDGADSPNAVFVADLDGDGDPDIMTASSQDDEIAWYENDGASFPTFTAHLISAAADGATDVFAADIDDDGDIDVLSASNLDDTIAWYENDGALQPAFTQRIIDTASDGANSAAAADLDRDGDLDVVAASGLDHSVSWFENDGASNPTFTKHVIISNATDAEDVCIADFDMDGDPDIAAACPGDGNIRLLENRGPYLSTISFTDRVLGNGSLGTTQSVSAGDLDGDGDRELAFSSQSGSNFSYLTNLLVHAGSSFLNSEATVWTGADGATCAAAGDIDGDGRVDLVVGSFFDDTVAWIRNSESGAQAPPIEIVNSASPGLRPDGVAAVAAVDLDRDGDTDAVSASILDGDVLWYDNNGAASPGFTVRAITLGLATPAGMAVGDAEGDGDLDVFIASASSGQIRIYLNDGQATPGFATNVQLNDTVASPRGIAVGDIEPDGDLDIVVASFDDDSVRVFRCTNPAIFAYTLEDISAGDIDGAVSVALADADRDGDLDVFAAALHDDAFLYFRNLQGLWGEQFVSFGNDGACWIAMGDIDGDGDIDGAGVARFDDEVLWFENVSVADGSPFTVHAISGTADAAYASALADFTGPGGNPDGLTDIAAVSFADDRVRLFDNLGGSVNLDTFSQNIESIFDGDAEAVLRVDMHHLGHDFPTEDVNIELTGVTLDFFDASGPLTNSEVNNLLQSVEIYRDDGDDVFDLNDLILTSLPPSVNASGRMEISLNKAGADAQATTSFSAVFWIVVALQPDASIQNPNVFRVEHVEAQTEVSDEEFYEVVRHARPEAIVSTPLMTAVPNPITGICHADINSDGTVGSTDLNILLTAWGMTVFPGQGADCNGDGFVNSTDLNILLSEWGVECAD